MERSEYLHKYYLDYNKPVFPGLSSAVSKYFLKAARISALLGALFILVTYTPSILYSLSFNKLDISKLLARTALKSKGEISQIVDNKPQKPLYQPRLDPTLPKDNMIAIPSAGISTKINEASYDNYEEALKLGVWRVSDFGTPSDRSLPTIFAAHRFGYLKWSIPYRLKNSFYNLPKLEVGDTVEIVWRQRKYVYEIYSEEKGEEIGDYTADLILYTCEDLSSPERIIKYANLLEI